MTNAIAAMGEKTSDHYVLKHTLQALGLFSLYFNDHQRAIKSFQRLREITEDMSDPQSEMEAVYKLALCYQTTKEHSLAIIALKKILQLAWIQNNFEFEMKAYDAIAKQYYYMGEMEKAKYYY
jgi:tetratricopeptide (TPR) repeat protein